MDYMGQIRQRHFSVEIDKLTNSIENTISGDSFKTEVLPVEDSDVRRLKKSDWLFDWKKENRGGTKSIYKLVITGNETIVQGLISLEDRGDHVFMHLIESSKFNRGARKLYLGVPGNLVAFACKLSFDLGYEGFVSFESKTKLIDHYRKTLGAFSITGKIMAIDTVAAKRLVNQYFPQ